MVILQEAADVKEQELWLSHGCKYVNDLWSHDDGRIVAPTSLYPWLARMSHGLSHVSKRGMCEIVLKDWFAPGFTSYAKNIVNCVLFVNNTTQGNQFKLQCQLILLLMDLLNLCK